MFDTYVNIDDDPVESCEQIYTIKMNLTGDKVRGSDAKKTSRTKSQEWRLQIKNSDVNDNNEWNMFF